MRELPYGGWSRCHRRKVAGWHPEQSTVCRTFQRLQQLLHVVIAKALWQPQTTGSYGKRLRYLRLRRNHPQPQVTVHYRLEGLSGAPRLLLKQACYVIIER